MKKAALFLLVFLLIISCGTSQSDNKFVYVKDGKFINQGKQYYFIGANFWYGAILSSDGIGGDTLRLKKELDFLKGAGINNLRVLVGSDGERGTTSKVEPTLQIFPGVYNDTILRGLDRLLVELTARDMKAVLYLNNSWEWSGGYSQYLMWTGFGKAPLPGVDGWNPFVNYVKQFVVNDSCKRLFSNYVKDIISRTNSITGVKYSQDPSIFSWQISNEPRAFAPENKKAFALWISEVAKLIKSIDSNHMVSTGSEGEVGCERDLALYQQIHSIAEIDYLNIHIWPYNWGWVSKENLIEGIEVAKDSTEEYINKHLQIAEKLNKPLVIEEFGYPRNNFLFSPASIVTARDLYYTFILKKVSDSANNKEFLAGCNFWAWGGFAVPHKVNYIWKRGDDYCGDPAQEPQGLNSVFAVDTSTVNLIKLYISKL